MACLFTCNELCISYVRENQCQNDKVTIIITILCRLMCHKVSSRIVVVWKKKIIQLNIEHNAKDYNIIVAHEPIIYLIFLILTLFNHFVIFKILHL